jgi:hypothetical protein
MQIRRNWWGRLEILHYSLSEASEYRLTLVWLWEQVKVMSHRQRFALPSSILSSNSTHRRGFVATLAILHKRPGDHWLATSLLRYGMWSLSTRREQNLQSDCFTDTNDPASLAQTVQCWLEYESNRFLGYSTSTHSRVVISIPDFYSGRHWHYFQHNL